ITLLGYAVVTRRTLFMLVEDRTSARRRNSRSQEHLATCDGRVEVFVDRFAIRVAERVRRARLSNGHFGLDGRQIDLITGRRAAVVFGRDDGAFASQLSDERFDVRRFVGAGASAASKVA